MRPLSSNKVGLHRAGLRAGRCAALLSILGGPALSDIGDDPHLNIVPRSAAEAEKVAAATALPDLFDKAEPFEIRPGGAATSFGNLGRDAFSQPSANLSSAAKFDFGLGKSLFEKLWVSAPSSTVSSDGLGPLFNARACESCHVNNGRGRVPSDGSASVSMFLRLSIPETASDLTAETLAYLAAAPDPVYGAQLQDKSLPGHPAEGRMAIRYTEQPIELAGGARVHLRAPKYSISGAGYGPPHKDLRLSARLAPQMIGLGLLEAVPAADILAGADPDDADGDGVSGRAARVWSEEYGRWMLGRFGHKASAPTIRAQSLRAFAHDIGLSNPLHPAGSGECTAAQAACRDAPDGATKADDDLEIGPDVADLVTDYVRNLAPPARERASDETVLRGKALFHASGCASCHRPKFVTHRLKDRPEQSFQLIWPYSDMLLHDLGPALADAHREWNAEGREWRTAPLWGLGHTAEVSGAVHLLHDGRARSILEAILWHGGEAKKAREAVRTMSQSDRDALLTFLESL